MQRHEDEVEIIPVSPLRRLEKRIEQIEGRSTNNTSEFYREMVDIIRMNQQIVDELAKANDALRIELSRLPSRLENLTSKLEELLSFIKASATEEVGGMPEGIKPFVQKMDELIDTNRKIAENNKSVLTVLEELEKKLRRPTLPPPIRRPLLPPRPIQ